MYTLNVKEPLSVCVPNEIDTALASVAAAIQKQQRLFESGQAVLGLPVDVLRHVTAILGTIDRSLSDHGVHEEYVAKQFSQLPKLRVIGDGRRSELNLSGFYTLSALNLQSCNVMAVKGGGQITGLRMDDTVLHTPLPWAVEECIVTRCQLRETIPFLPASIRLLVLQGCNSELIESLPSTYDGKGIKVLGLLACELTEVPAKLTAVFPNLVSLSLEKNHLQSIENLPNGAALECLNVAHNNLRTLGTLARLGLSSLTELNLSNNSLISLDGLQACVALKRLDLSCNLIESWPDVKRLARLPQLLSLFMYTNPIQKNANYRILVCGLVFRGEMYASGDVMRQILLDSAPFSPHEIKKSKEICDLNLEKSEGGKTSAEESIALNTEHRVKKVKAAPRPAAHETKAEAAVQCDEFCRPAPPAQFALFAQQTLKLANAKLKDYNLNLRDLSDSTFEDGLVYCALVNSLVEHPSFEFKNLSAADPQGNTEAAFDEALRCFGVPPPRLSAASTAQEKETARVMYISQLCLAASLRDATRLRLKMKTLKRYQDELDRYKEQRKKDVLKLKAQGDGGKEGEEDSGPL